MYNASVTPRNFEFTVFDVTFRTQLYPIAIEKKIDIFETYVKLVWPIIILAYAYQFTIYQSFTYTG